MSRFGVFSICDHRSSVTNSTVRRTVSWENGLMYGHYHVGSQRRNKSSLRNSYVKGYISRILDKNFVVNI